MLQFLYIVFLRAPRAARPSSNGPWQGKLTNPAVCRRLGVGVLIWSTPYPIHPMTDWSLS